MESHVKHYHECSLETGSTSCLAKLPPNASILRRTWRRFRKFLLVSESHESTKYHFRSKAAILSERKRQNFSYPSYIIHPFSSFSYYREVVLFFVYIITFILSPVSNTFLFHDTLLSTMGPIHAINFCTDVVIMINIGLCFASGYQQHQTKEIILDPKKIALHYMKTYFWTDFIGAAPIMYFLPHRLRNKPIKLFLLAKHLMIYPRVLTMLQYFRHITILLRIADAPHEIICMIAFSFYLLHWSSCILYVVQYIYYIFERNDGSWMELAEISPRLMNIYRNISLMRRYTWCLHMAVSHFYRIDSGIYETKSTGDYFTLSLIMIVGSIYYAYILVIVLQAIGTANAAESKYEELMRQIYDYLRTKKMPLHINLRLQMYYEYRFQKRYFREQSILSTLSEHLRYEIKLYTCRHLIGKVDIFKGLSKSIIGSIIGGLTLDIYLTNDVIIQCDNPVEHWYIISYGTIAVIHKDGAEICHLEDGECFGEIPLLTDRNDITYVATEISEVFRMPKVDFIKYMANDTIGRRIRAMIETRQNMARISIDRYEYRKERQEILYKVRSGKILEKGHRRR